MSRQVTPQPGEMPRAFAERMAEALSALLGSELAVREADRSADADWLLEAVDETTPPRRVVVGVAAADASAIAGRVRGGAVADDQVESVLSQVWSACLERSSEATDKPCGPDALHEQRVLRVPGRQPG